ncbi:MAG: Asp-tRNA(Asn)/Glu-tRNA(Gln) amidotransferase subunit GatA [Burkholderiaceae bacterium]|jgi:aspartyl-tRNA(Asn)/glutamyl-tRNA(Gln) amidotransferase subunit A|nr:Asp-tRNA(Asn)/Glu-tRNA(Gln) amidotransferase subunit GatA [Burkholderiales bacterium]MCZ8096453.1 Asp-tRNA(Asn)/Glu-tRNA(Gln) amidotransferase subunit GatA [Burkholderiales bacterium]MCZ8338271.1 Asp-tRNA(Asn)/Glu-tRNA(Gln) amidotransferase subunit GatA [Burkholderiaceae bacterium]
MTAPTSAPLHARPVSALRAALDAGEVSARSLAEHYLARIATSTLNAFVDVRPESTLEQARAADERLARGERAPLLGIPVAHKDIFVTRGWRSTAGSRMLADYVSPFDATVVERLAAAGAVCLGKTNCDEFAMGSSNEHSHFGPTRNPWDPAAIPGGSSGGSAAAVAGGLAPIATGTDTGGSVRQPAAMCGVTGIKPTYGRVSRFGMIAFASSLDQGGAFGGSAADCAALLSAMAGFDARDATSLERPAEDYVAGMAAPPVPAGRGEATTASRPLAGLRVGVPKEYFGEGLAPDVEHAVRAGLATLESLGAALVDVSLPRTRLAIPAYYVIAPAEASSNLSRFDGVRYGHRAKDPTDLKDLYRRTRAEGFGEEVRRRIMVGTYVLSHGYYDAYYLQAQKLRRLIADDFAAAFSTVDVIAGPVAPTVAWDLGDHSSDPVRDYLADVYTLGASLAGLPGLSMPAGFGAKDRPVGLQLIADRFGESRLLAVADRFQQATDWHLRRPAA